MPGENEGRLFHTLVLMGIGLTGSVVAPALAGCGGSTSTETKPSLDAAPDAPYAMIGYVRRDSGYPTIGNLPIDAGGDVSYPSIRPADLTDAAYPIIGTIGRDATP